MARTKGSLNNVSVEARQQLAEILEVRGEDLREWGLEVIFKGKVKGVSGKVDLSLRVSVWREMMGYAFAKQATIKHEIEQGDKQISFTWENPEDEAIEGEIVN